MAFQNAIFYIKTLQFVVLSGMTLVFTPTSNLMCMKSPVAKGLIRVRCLSNI